MFTFLAMKYAALRALLATVLGIILAQTKISSWLLVPLFLLAGLTLLRITNGFSQYFLLSAIAFIYTRTITPLPPHPAIHTLSSFSGVVVSEPDGYHPRRTVLELKPPLHGKVMLFFREPSPAIRYGDFITVRSKIRKFDFPRNPGLIDYHQVMKQKGFVGSAKVKTGQITIISRNQGNLFTRLVVMPSRRFIFRTVKNLIGKEEGALLIGLLFGDKSGLPKELQTAFTDSGLLHILAVSGLHIGIVIGALLLLLSVLRVSGWWRFGISVAGTIFYLALTGWAPAPARAGLMAGSALLSIPTQRRLTPLTTLFVAGLIILFIEPNALFIPGTQLSFAATASILTITPKTQNFLSRLKIPSWLNTYISVSLAATIGTAPLLLHHFARFQPLALFSSIVVVPLVTLTLPLGLLMFITALISTTTAGILAESVRLLLSIILTVTNWLGKLSFFIIEPGKLSWTWVFWFYSLLILLLNWKNKRVRTPFRLGLAFGLATIIWSAAFTKPQTKITFLDPVKGDAILLEDTLGRKILFDCGIDRTGVLFELFRTRGIKKLDAVVITHPDRDHYGGLLDLPERFKIDRLIIPTDKGDTFYQKLLKRYQLNGTKILFAQKGSEITGFGFKIEFLAPDGTDRWLYHQGLLPTNSVSLVARVKYKESSLLLTGDWERPETFLNETTKIWLIKSPHHGSRKGNPPALFDSLKPEYVVVMGRYPTPARLETLLTIKGIKYINTRRDGGVVLKFLKETPLWLTTP